MLPEYSAVTAKSTWVCCKSLCNKKEGAILYSSNKYIGTSSSGIKIELWIKDGIVDTAYPIKLK